MFDYFKRNKKGMITLALLLLLGTSSLFGAGDFDNLDKTVEELDASGKKTVGTGGSWVIGMLPFAIMFIGALLGFKQAKKDAKQDQEDSNKPATYAITGTVVGGIAAILVIAIFGLVTMQDSSKGLLVLKNFWLTAFGLAG